MCSKSLKRATEQIMFNIVLSYINISDLKN